MRETKRNLSASVLARLLKRAQETGEEYQMVLARYCFERFLYRLGMSNGLNRMRGKDLTGSPEFERFFFDD